MKKKMNARKVIRQIVREEVAVAIREVITELRKPTQQVSQPKPKNETVEKKDFSNNPILNEVLNETEGGLPTDEYPTMGGTEYTTNRMNEVLGSAYSDLGNNPSQPNGNLAAEMGVNPEEPGMDFLKKDYRAVMKAVDKKKAGGPLKGA